MFRKLQTPVVNFFKRRSQKKFGLCREERQCRQSGSKAYSINPAISDSFMYVSPEPAKMSTSSSFNTMNGTKNYRPHSFVDVPHESIYEQIESIFGNEEIHDDIQGDSAQTFLPDYQSIKRRLVFIEAKLSEAKRQLRNRRSSHSNTQIFFELKLDGDDQHLSNLIRDLKQTRRELKSDLRSVDYSLPDRTSISYKMYPSV